MTDYLVRLSQHSPGAPASGWVPADEVAVTGSISCRPFAPDINAARVHAEGPDRIILPEAFSVRLVNGEATLSLRPTDAWWCWELREQTKGGRIRHLSVADSALVLDYADAVDVDPATLTPAASAVPAWTAAVDAVQGYANAAALSETAAETAQGLAEDARDAAQALTDVTVTTGAIVGDDLILTRTDATTTNAGNVRGPQGTTGATGPANTLAIGTVTTGAAGSSASATITGVAPGQTLSLTIPRGDTGMPSSLVDAKGDLLVGSANDTVVRLPAAADGSVLVTDSAQASGLKYEGPTVFPRTTAQTLSTAEKTQALANLGVTPGTTVGAMPYVSDANGSIKTQPVVPLLVNKLTNSDFSNGTTGWFGNNGAITNEGNTLILTAADAVTPGYVRSNATILAGNQYYVSVRFTPFRTHNMLISLGGVYLNSPNSAAAGIATQVSATITALQASGLVAFYSNAAVATGQTTGARAEFDNAVCIDLTAAFGAGFEPSKAEMDKLMAQWGGWFADTDPKLVKDFDKWNRRGTGSPEGVVTAEPGVKWTDTANTNGAKEWRKDTGTGSTGWVVTVGDTGLRTLTSWTSGGVVTGDALPANVAPTSGVAGAVTILRVGEKVTYGIRGATFTGAASFTVPVGFRSALAQYRPAVVIVSSAPVLTSATIGTTTLTVGASGQSAHATNGTTITWDCTTWPTSLPGTAG